MRFDHQRLQDMLDAIDALARFLRGHTLDSFLAAEVLRSATARQLTVIGEAAARVSPDLKNRYPSVPWPDIVAFRNILVHEYFGLLWPVVWNAATEDAPALGPLIAGIISAEFPPTP